MKTNLHQRSFHIWSLSKSHSNQHLRVRDYCWCVLMFSKFPISPQEWVIQCTRSCQAYPALSIAGSIISGLLVAPMTNTPFLSFKPSNSVNKVLTTLELDSDIDVFSWDQRIQLIKENNTRRRGSSS